MSAQCARGQHEPSDAGFRGRADTFARRSCGLVRSAAVSDLVKASLPRAGWGSAVAVFTVVFAVGQSIGPVMSGGLVDATHSLDASLAASVVILLAAGAAALLQQAPGSPALHVVPVKSRIQRS